MSAITVTGKEVILKFNPKKIVCVRMITSEKNPNFQTVIQVMMKSGERFDKKLSLLEDANKTKIYNNIIKEWHDALNRKPWLGIGFKEVEFISIITPHEFTKVIYDTFNLTEVEAIEFQQKEEIMDAEITYIKFHMSNEVTLVKRYTDWRPEREVEFNAYVEKWKKII